MSVYPNPWLVCGAEPSFITELRQIADAQSRDGPRLCQVDKLAARLSGRGEDDIPLAVPLAGEEWLRFSIWLGRHWAFQLGISHRGASGAFKGEGGAVATLDALATPAGTAAVTGCGVGAWTLADCGAGSERPRWHRLGSSIA